jgi:hypothetical protein
MITKLKKSKLIGLYRAIFAGNHTMAMKTRVSEGLDPEGAFAPPVSRQVKKILSIVEKNAGRQFHSEEVDRIILGMIQTLEKSRTIKLV